MLISVFIPIFILGMYKKRKKRKRKWIVEVCCAFQFSFPLFFGGKYEKQKIKQRAGKYNKKKKIITNKLNSI